MRRTHARLRLMGAGFAYPAPDKLRKGARAVCKREMGHAGEDAYFVDPDGAGLGVADGVWQWQEDGVDAGEYARTLMRQAALSVRQGRSAIDALFDADQAAADANVPGSSTCCIVSFDHESGDLECSLVGDSGILVVRRETATGTPEILLRTPQQEHSFGFPFQLGGNDTAEDALHFSLGLRAGDVVLAGTDGLFDNLEDAALAAESFRIIDAAEAEGLPLRSTLSRIAQTLVQKAFSTSMDRMAVTPFSRAAAEELELCFAGKPDDIAVCASIVIEAD